MDASNWKVRTQRSGGGGRQARSHVEELIKIYYLDIEYSEHIEYIEYIEYSKYIEYIEYIEYSKYIEYIEYIEYSKYIEYIEYIEQPVNYNKLSERTTQDPR
jgi:hypothetical protein